MADTKRTAGLVLRSEDAGSAEPHVFPGVPGRYTPGQPVAVSDLDLTRAEAGDLVEKLGVPLESANAKVDADGELFAKTGGIPSDSDALSWPPPSVRAATGDRSAVPGLTEDELAARDEYDAPREAAAQAARDGGYDLPTDVPTSPGSLTDAAVVPAVAAVEAAEAHEQPEEAGG